MQTFMQLVGLYAITDPDLLPGMQLVEAAAAAIDGGATIVQYRNKRADSATRRREAEILNTLCREAGALLLINDDIDLALSCGAHGVHLGQQDGTIAEARARLGDDAVIGQSCYASLERAITAQAAGANYVAFGRFFASHTKPQAAPAEIALLAEARAVIDIPIVAIGGVTVANAPALIRAGADAVAVIHGLFGATDVAARAREFTALFNRGPI